MLHSKDNMSITEYPAELVCPISQDLMNDPVTITHLGADYTFDRNCIETWKTTQSGDQNPLTMLTGFKEAPMKEAIEIKSQVRNFRVNHGLELEQETEKVELQPFSDYQQIQDDEAEARRLNRELNGPDPSEILQQFRDYIDGRNFQIHHDDDTNTSYLLIMVDVDDSSPETAHETN